MASTTSAIDSLENWAQRLLVTERNAHLATASSDGRPLVVPVCFVLHCGTVLSPIDGKPKSSRELERIRNIRQNPQVSLMVDRWSEDWQQLAWVLLRGHASVVEGGDELATAVALLREKYPQYEELGLLTTANRAIRIDPESVRSWRWSEPGQGGRS